MKINFLNNGNCLIEPPNFCPYCNKEIFPNLHSYRIDIATEAEAMKVSSFKLGAIFSCPGCHQSIFANYSVTYNFYDDCFYVANLISVYPYPSPKIDISKEIQESYPDFYNVYIQAIKAENIGLTEICGMGFRKSLEILVKQYLINQNNSLKDKILAESLSQSINRIENFKIKTLALGAVWLGNDETHIIRKFTNYDINDMKGFISALCHLISLDITFEKATLMINSRKKN